MEKLDPQKDGATPDIVAQNVEELKRLFPEIVTEGKLDFDTLREVLGDYPDERDERYSFTWNGKSRARRLAQTPSTGTLRPCPEESVNWETTQNLFIEGENLEVLKLLQKSYHRKVKMIYIDPPYNTGKEFIYPDDFRDSIGHYLEITKQTDEEGRRLRSNPETSGRYHTDWLNMMYTRLKLARNLLRNDGVIFISIDDHELHNLRAICNEVFGEENFIATAIWQRVYAPKNTAKHFSEDHDYVVVYSRSSETWRPNLIPRSEEADARYKNPDNDARGPWKSSDLTARNFYSEGQYVITGPTGREFRPGRGRYWRQSLQKFEELDADNRVWWGPDGSSMPAQKRFLSEVKQGIVPQTLWKYELVGHTQEAKKELLQFVDFEYTENVLNSVKPTRLLRHMLRIVTSPDTHDLILDFFAGSAALGHAVLLQNQEDGGDRRYILVQLPEPLPKEEPDIHTIADMGKRRLVNVGKSIEEERKEAEDEARERLPGAAEGTPITADTGFRVLKLDTSSIKAWDAEFDDDVEGALLSSVENVKPDRNEADVLYELLLKFGLDLAVPMEKREIAGKAVHVIGAGALIVCLADDISIEVVEGVAALKKELAPETVRVVFKDAGFADDVVKTNAVQILRQAGIDDVRSL
jgi:adenine-specific DNA-methyltransferase